jgi:type IV pilus assembly protein PilX
MARPEQKIMIRIDNNSKQRGAILVTSLLLLLVLTVLGVAMMRMTTMQERMAGNTRDLNLGFQGAEAALRDGEDRINPFRIPPWVVPNATGGATCDICQPGSLPVAIEYDVAFWNASGRVYGALSGAPAIPGLLEQPRYAIEEVAFIPDDFLRGQDYYEDGRFFYQITARSTGASGLANVVLQSTFARPR